MTLQFADPAPSEYLSILLYGPEGSGKTTAAMSAPDPIIFCNADGKGAMRFARWRYRDKQMFPLAIDGKQPLIELYTALRKREPGIADTKTVVIDSLGRLYDILLYEVAGDHPSLPQRGDINTFIERYILGLLELPVHVVLVAHDNPVVTSGSEEQGTANIELFPFVGTNNPALAKKLMRAVDIVGYCGRKTEGEGNNKMIFYMAQLFAAGGRRAKDRTDVLGDFAPLNLSKWIDDITAQYQPTKEAAA